MAAVPFFEPPGELSPPPVEKLFRFESRREAALLLGSSFVFALVFLYPILCEAVYLGPGLHDWITKVDLSHLTKVPINNDSDLFAELRWVPYWTLTHFHQAPFWNPYKCGGMSLLGNPESGIVTPFLLPYLVFGLVTGLLLEIYLHLAIGFAGGYVLGRELGLRKLPSTVLAVMFPSSSWLPLHISVGHLNFLPAVYLPWILAMLLAACRMKRWGPTAIGGALCALTLTQGNYTFVYAAMLVAICGVSFSLMRRSLRPLAAAALLGCFALSLGALKLLPVADWLSLHPRPDFGASWLTWSGALTSLFSRNQDLYRPSTGPFYFSEFGGYLGAPFVVLASIAMIGAWRKVLPWVLGCAIFYPLFMGDTGPHALITYLRLLPMGNNMGLCGRWVIPLVFCVGVLSALGAQFLCERAGRWGARVVALVLVAGLIDAWVVGSPNYRYIFHYDMDPPAKSEHFRQYWVSTPLFMTYINQANMGSVNCDGFGYGVPRGAVRGYNEAGYRGEFFLLGDGSAVQSQWSPNRLSFAIDAKVQSTLVINQNFDRDWRLASGQGAMVDHGALLAVRVPAGRQSLTLVYRPACFPIALLITLVGLAAAVMLWLWSPCRARAQRLRSTPC